MEKVAEKGVKLEYVDTKEQVENIFTKPLLRRHLNFSNIIWYLLLPPLESRGSKGCRGAWSSFYKKAWWSCRVFSKFVLHGLRGSLFGKKFFGLLTLYC
jgi:hypothetical protein